MEHENADNSNIWNSPQKLILASRSATRHRLLEQARIPFEPDPANIDERCLESEFVACGGRLENIARLLAQAKAIDVSRRHPGSLCLGADQVLVVAGRVLHKAESLADLESHLQKLSGRVHLLLSAFAIARDAQVMCEGVEVARMTVRPLDEGQIALYLRCAGSDVYETVGGYMFETVGVHIFEKIEGDNATILGLPILPVLSALRRQGALLL